MQDLTIQSDLPEIQIAPTTGDAPIFSKSNLPYLAILVVATFVALIPTLSAGFVDWDDPANVLENKLINYGLGWHAIKDIFTSAVNDNYNPLTILSFAVEKTLFAPYPVETPFIFHFNNLWMHIVNTLLVFALFLKLKLSPRAAFIGALLFGIHPMRVESVAWVTERKDMLYSLFYLSALICYINFTKGDEKRKKWYALAVILALLSCFSKLQAVTLPLSFIAIDYYTGRAWISERILVREKLPFWLLSLIFGLGTLFFLKRSGYLEPVIQLIDYSFIDKLAISAYTYAVMLVKWVYPYKMTFYYDFPAQVPLLAYVLLFIVPLALIALIMWAARNRFNFLVFGIVFFTVNTMFLIHILPLETGLMADRVTYIAYFGLFFMLARGYELLTASMPQKAKAMNMALGLYCLLFAVITYFQARVWKNTITLCEHYIATTPDNYYGYNQIGSFFFRRSFAEEDRKKLNMLQNAKHYFRAANEKDSISGRPFPVISSDILQSEAVICGLLGEQQKAIYYFSDAIALTPKSVEAFKNRAYQYFLDKKFLLAIADYSVAVNLSPKDYELYYLRANCYYSKGDLVNARDDLDKSIALKPDDPNILIARSVIHRAQNNLVDARNDAIMAKRLGGDVPDMYLQ